MKVPNGLAGPPHLRPGRIARPAHRPGASPGWGWPGRRVEGHAAICPLPLPSL